MKAPEPVEVYTIGHSNRELDEVVRLLTEFGIDVLADIRSFPGSRTCPQFDRESLERALPENGIRYTWLRALGGRRRSPRDFASPNPGWRHPAFRAYADYMLTPEFRRGIDELLALAVSSRTAIMCAEAVYWRCHRRLVSDYLVAHGHRVIHIMGAHQTRDHTLTPGALLQPDGSLIYPLPPDQADQLPLLPRKRKA